jgi:hypothetical protein
LLGATSCWQIKSNFKRRVSFPENEKAHAYFDETETTAVHNQY